MKVDKSMIYTHDHFRIRSHDSIEKSLLNWRRSVSLDELNVNTCEGSQSRRAFHFHFVFGFAMKIVTYCYTILKFIMEIIFIGLTILFSSSLKSIKNI